jgi:autotransporter-associated beta strand protein
VLEELCCPVCPQTGDGPEIFLPFDINGDDRGCFSRCCGLPDTAAGNCARMRVADCVAAGGTPFVGCCEPWGCPLDCCSEDADGVVQCESIAAGQCVAPKMPADPDCATGCLGQCCIDDEEGVPQPQGMMTQQACAEMQGKWQGLGVEDCGDCACRLPFSCDCCESKTSTAAGLTFTQPRNKRQPPFSDTFHVTVTGRTDSTILVHGTPVAAGCDFTVEFVLCWDMFNIEPVPCGTNFKSLDVTVCWQQQHTGTEELNFSGCDGLTIHLGDCEHDCVTTLVYNQSDSRSSDATIYTRNDATFYVQSGTVEFTGTITPVSQLKDSVPCANDPRVLTLSGGVGKISGVIEDLPGGSLDVVQTSIIRDGVRVGGDGEWWLSGDNSFSGVLRLLHGTMVIAADVSSSVGAASPFGTTSAGYPQIGNPAAGVLDYYGAAVLLVADGVTIGRGFTITALGSGSQQVVTVGCRAGATATVASTAPISIGADREIILQAGSGGEITFANPWSGTAASVTFGSVGNEGAAVLNQAVQANEYHIVLGTLRQGGAGISGFGILDRRKDITIGSDDGDATFDINGHEQTMKSLSFVGSDNVITGGTLRLGYNDAAGADNGTVSVTGTGHEIASDVALANDTTITANASSDLTISGTMSGASALTLDGSGIVTLSAANTRSGTTTISGCTVDIGDDDALGTGNVTVTSGGVLNLNGHTIPGTITNSGGTVNP